MGYVPKETNYESGYSMKGAYKSHYKEDQNKSPTKAYNYHEQEMNNENVESSEGESGFTSFDSI